VYINNPSGVATNVGVVITCKGSAPLPPSLPHFDACRQVITEFGQSDEIIASSEEAEVTVTTPPETLSATEVTTEAQNDATAASDVTLASNPNLMTHSFKIESTLDPMEEVCIGRSCPPFWPSYPPLVASRPLEITDCTRSQCLWTPPSVPPPTSLPLSHAMPQREALPLSSVSSSILRREGWSRWGATPPTTIPIASG
jgi:hypothetical protein